MRRLRLVALVALGLTLSIGGNVMADQVADEQVKAKNLIKCSTCGVEFTLAAGVVGTRPLPSRTQGVSAERCIGQMFNLRSRIH